MMWTGDGLAMTGRTCFAVTPRGRNPKSGFFTPELADNFAVVGAMRKCLR